MVSLHSCINYQCILLLLGSSEFSSETEEKKLDEAVQGLKGLGDLAVRLKIKELVEQNWERLLHLAKEVIDSRLADGNPSIFVSI